MEESRLTVVIPVYNREKWLPRTLASVAAQTCRAFRLILVDNASTDRSWALCEQFCRQQEEAGRLTVRVTKEEKPGAACARNRGLALCTTPYIYFFDSDDEMSPDFVEKLLPELSDDIDVVALTTVLVNQQREQVRAYSHQTSPAVHILNAMLSTVSMVLRTDFLRTIGGWDETLRTWDDWELGVRVLIAHPRLTWYTRQSFHRIYVHSESLTGRNFSSTWPWIQRALQAVWNDVRHLPADTRERIQAEMALCYRQAILCGTLRAEHNAAAADECRQLQQRMLPLPAWNRWLAEGLCQYTAHGGRGAWRLALGLL